ncbi:hypothetical protein THAOC_01534, partial [Thalassiosira oceanica]
PRRGGGDGVGEVMGYEAAAWDMGAVVEAALSGEDKKVSWLRPSKAWGADFQNFDYDTTRPKHEYLTACEARASSLRAKPASGEGPQGPEKGWAKYRYDHGQSTYDSREKSVGRDLVLKRLWS